MKRKRQLERTYTVKVRAHTKDGRPSLQSAIGELTLLRRRCIRCLFDLY